MPASAATPVRPAVTTDRAQAGAGESITVTGSGFPAGAPLAVDLFSDPVRLATTVADASGRFRLVVTIPLGTSPGLHTVRVSVVGGTQFAHVSLLVTAPAATAVARPALSRTGGEFTRTAGLALVLMVAGLALVGLAWPGGQRAWGGGRRSPWPHRRR